MRASLALLVAAAAGCAPVLAAAPPARVVAPGLLSVEAAAGCHAADVDEVDAAARQALPALERWGPPASPVHVILLPSHAALERAVHRPGFDWLRAWARYDVVYLQAPHSWGFLQGTPAQLRDILTHELTHCAMFQASASPTDWAERGVPFWFREGLASWAAGQLDRRWSRGELADALRAAPALEPLADGEALSRARPDLAYSAAHWAVATLIARRGEARVRELLAAMKAGASFDVAFHEAFGESVWAFQSRFEDALRRGLR